MPLYDIRCASCQKEFEFLVRGHDWQKEVQCPHCGPQPPERFEKLPSRIGISSAARSGSSGHQSGCSCCH